MSYRIMSWVALPFILGVLPFSYGCVLMDAHVTPAFVADAGHKSPLERVAPVRIALLVEDQRPSEEREFVGHRRNGYGGVSAKVLNTKPIVSVFYDALASELQNNGHQVDSIASESTQRVVKISVKRFWTENRMNFFDTTLSAVAFADTTIHAQTTDVPTLSRPVTGTAEESRQIANEGAYQDALNKALAEFVRSFARDSEILRALRLPNPGN